MRRLFLPAFIFGFAIGVLPAIAQRRIADQREVDLYRQSAEEPEPLKRLVALTEWQAFYPNSEFERERLLFFAMAYKESGQAANALQSAVQMLKSDARDINALVMIAKIGPTLDAPSLDQVKVVEEAAVSILSLAPLLARAATSAPTQAQAVAEAAALQASDPETERVVQLIREWRRDKPIKTAVDVEGEFRAIAEPALAWARKSK